jgi:2-iminobutanoate/2-iminopropanoate deaminase
VLPARSCIRAISWDNASTPTTRSSALLEKHGATLGDIAKMVTYITDVRYQPDYGKCRVESFGSHPLPAHTLLTISQLAWPGMIVEIDVTAIVPLK